MTIYKATFRTDIAFAIENIDADTPEQALQLARARAESDPATLDWESYDPGHELPDEIEITAPDGGDRVIWQSDDLILRLAASTLLSALKLAVEALNIAPRFNVRHLDTDSYKIAAVCDAAINEATG